MLYPINTIIAIDQATGARVENGSGYVYAVSDTARATPLAIYDLSGLPLTSNLLTTNSEALIPPFQVEGEWQVVFVSGDSEIILTSYMGLKEEAAASADAANEVATKANNGEFKGAQGDSAYQVWLSLGNTGTVEDYRADIEGPPGKDGSNVLPTDEAIEQAVTTDGTATNAALKATFATKDSIPSRPLAPVASPSEQLARFVDFGGGSHQVGAVAADSTWNDGNDPMRKTLMRLGQITPAGVGMKERLWDEPSGGYPTVVDVKAGNSTADTGGTVLADNFNRTTAELVGTTTSGGQVWAGTTGGWSAGGAMATANSSTACIGYDTGSTAHTATAVYSIITTAQAAQSQVRLIAYATRANVNTGGNYVWAQILMETDGSTSLSLWKRISGVQTEILATTPINGVTAGTATPQQVTVALDVAIQQVTCTVTVGGVDQVLTATVTEADAGALGSYSVLMMPANAYGAFKVDSVDFSTPFTPGTYTGLEVYNAAVAGTTLGYHTARIATMYPDTVAFDWVVITGGHNNGTQDGPTFIAEVDGFVQAFKAAHPETLIVISSQNPQFAPSTTITAHARRQAALRDYAMSNGYEYLPVFEAFSNQTDGGDSFVQDDGIHPTVPPFDTLEWAGSTLWAAVWLTLIDSRRQVGTVVPITALP